MMVPPLQVFHATGPDALAAAVAHDHLVILVDVLRASSTIITALANGASSVIPVATVEDARRLARQLPDALLAGERATHPPRGFDYGNSPRSFLTSRIKGRPIVLTTSNFTRTLGTPPTTATVLVGAFLNLEHVAATVRALHHQRARLIAIISAGELGGPSVEDDLASKHIANRLQHPQDPPSYASAEDLARDLLVTKHGSLLVRAGYEDDITFCSQPNRYALTPILCQGVFAPYSPR